MSALRIAPVGTETELTRSRIERIYTSSFPEEERDAFDTVFLAQRGQLVWMATHDEVPVGFAVILWLPGLDVGLLEYIATEPSMRSAGVGRAMLDSITRSAELDGRRRIVLEVEDPAAATDPPMAQRRIGFYERWGAEPVRCLRRYFMPNFRAPDEELPMVLMERRVAAKSGLHSDELRRVLSTIYECEYHHVSGGKHLATLLNEVWC